eukprot:m.42417 g.42417  ORF g.42417 m.42417 type:complete len:741 (-) comp9880_c0_seq2:143-2365(-)
MRNYKIALFMIYCMAGTTHCDGKQVKAIGTFLEPWYTNRMTYHWNVFNATQTRKTKESLLFGDVDGDGKDDAIIIAAPNTSVFLSDGKGQFDYDYTFDKESEECGNTTALTMADMTGNGLQDFVFHQTHTNVHQYGAWCVYVNNNGHSVVSTPVVIPKQHTCPYTFVTDGLLWCIALDTTNTTGTIYTIDYETQNERNITLSTTTTSVAQLWIQTLCGDEEKTKGGKKSSACTPELVMLGTDGNVYIALLSNTKSTTITRITVTLDTMFTLAATNYSGRLSRDCLQNILLADNTITLPNRINTQYGALVCVEESSGYWYAVPLLPSAPNTPQTVWKYSHGGLIHLPTPPSPNGEFPGQGNTTTYADFHLADPIGNGVPSPLACNNNNNSTNMNNNIGCLIMPPGEEFGHSTPQWKGQPSLKSTNVNLWQAWNIPYEPLLHDGSFGGYDSADMQQAGYMFDYLTELGITFFIADLTNGFGVDFGNTLDSARKLAGLCAKNINNNGTRMHYSFSFGVNPLGSYDDPAVLPKMEEQFQQYYNMFINTSSNGGGVPGYGGGEALADAAFRHPVTNKPVVVLYVEPQFEQIWSNYQEQHPELTTYSRMFHIGYADGNNWRPGLWGWMIDKTCGPPNTYTQPCGSTATVGLRRDNNTMYISPAYSYTADTQTHYACKESAWYESQFNIVADTCPDVLIVGAFNDYTENNGWYPTKCALCEDGEEHDPFLLSNITQKGLALVHASCV